MNITRYTRWSEDKNTKSRLIILRWEQERCVRIPRATRASWFFEPIFFMFNILNSLVWNLNDEERFPLINFLVCKSIISTITKWSKLALLNVWVTVLDYLNNAGTDKLLSAVKYNDHSDSSFWCRRLRVLASPNNQRKGYCIKTVPKGVLLERLRSYRH